MRSFHSPEVVNCLSVLLTIYHPIIEPLLPSLLCELACTANDKVSYMVTIQVIYTIYLIVRDEVD